jgi:uncharacterized integral membrane protein
MNKLPFVKKNYQLMLVGVLLLIIGLTVMAMDTDPHGFGFFGITLSPIIVVSGFIVEIFAILYSPKEK